jgi:hypothetical protein
MPPFAFAPVTIPNARANVARERPARRTALVIPGIESGGREAIRPWSQRPRQSRHAGSQIRRDQPDLALCPFHFSAAQNSAASGKMRKRLSFVAAVLPPLMRTRT